MSGPDRVPADYFAAMYAEADDPWDFGGRWYERRKRALTMAMLPRPRFTLALEPGCGPGYLTELLAARCDRVVAGDVDPQAREVARRRTVALPGIEVVDWTLGVGSWPASGADLLVLSEVGYYFSRPALREVVAAATAAVAADGTVVAAHWRHPVAEHILDGDTVHRALRETRAWRRLGGYQDEDVVVDVFTAGPSVSVARREGLA